MLTVKNLLVFYIFVKINFKDEIYSFQWRIAESIANR